MKLPNYLALILLLVCGQALAEGRAKPWHDPAAVPIITRLSLEQIANAIRTGAKEREWTYANEKPGYVELSIAPRDHLLKLALSYDSRQYRLSYLDSRNLNYSEENGQRLLHPSAPSWANNLISAINIQLLRATPLEQE